MSAASGAGDRRLRWTVRLGVLVIRALSSTWRYRVINGDVVDALSIGAVYSLLDAEDRTPGSANRGNELARRPDHALTLMADWQAIESLSFGADLRVLSDSFDDAANLVPLGGYEVLTVRASWEASEHVTLFGRVENVWDETYQTAAGYATAGRGAYVGARARW